MIDVEGGRGKVRGGGGREGDKLIPQQVYPPPNQPARHPPSTRFPSLRHILFSLHAHLNSFSLSPFAFASTIRACNAADEWDVVRREARARSL
jgi:hypothetical protein